MRDNKNKKDHKDDTFALYILFSRQAEQLREVAPSFAEDELFTKTIFQSIQFLSDRALEVFERLDFQKLQAEIRDCYKEKFSIEDLSQNYYLPRKVVCEILGEEQSQ